MKLMLKEARIKTSSVLAWHMIASISYNAVQSVFNGTWSLPWVAELLEWNSCADLIPYDRVNTLTWLTVDILILFVGHIMLQMNIIAPIIQPRALFLVTEVKSRLHGTLCKKRGLEIYFESFFVNPEQAQHTFILLLTLISVFSHGQALGHWSGYIRYNWRRRSTGESTQWIRQPSSVPSRNSLRHLRRQYQAKQYGNYPCKRQLSPWWCGKQSRRSRKLYFRLNLEIIMTVSIPSTNTTQNIRSCLKAARPLTYGARSLVGTLNCSHRTSDRRIKHTVSIMQKRLLLPCFSLDNSPRLSKSFDSINDLFRSTSFASCRQLKYTS